jgi:hypothetical protein
MWISYPCQLVWTAVGSRVNLAQRQIWADSHSHQQREMWRNALLEFPVNEVRGVIQTVVSRSSFTMRPAPRACT